MKKIILAVLCSLTTAFCSAQDFDAPINHHWAAYAADTSLTYQQIVYICDSLASYKLHT